MALWFAGAFPESRDHHHSEQRRRMFDHYVNDESKTKYPATGRRKLSSGCAPSDTALYDPVARQTYSVCPWEHGGKKCVPHEKPPPREPPRIQHPIHPPPYASDVCNNPTIPYRGQKKRISPPSRPATTESRRCHTPLHAGIEKPEGFCVLHSCTPHSEIRGTGLSLVPSEHYGKLNRHWEQVVAERREKVEDARERWLKQKSEVIARQGRSSHRAEYGIMCHRKGRTHTPTPSMWSSPFALNLPSPRVAVGHADIHSSARRRT